MKVLIIEDSPIKLEKIQASLREMVPAVELLVRASYASGLAAIRNQCPDIVLLDMTLPNYDISQEDDGGRKRAFGGRDILHQIVRRKLNPKVIVITQYQEFSTKEKTLSLEQLSKELRDEFGQIYVGTVFFDQASENWRGQLSSFVVKAAESF